MFYDNMYFKIVLVSNEYICGETIRKWRELLEENLWQRKRGQGKGRALWRVTGTRDVKYL